jgi:hypothetical protein
MKAIAMNLMCVDLTIGQSKWFSLRWILNNDIMLKLGGNHFRVLKNLYGNLIVISMKRGPDNHKTRLNLWFTGWGIPYAN